jgi:cysteine-rich repeat protein
VDLLSEFAPPSDLAMSGIRRLLANYSINGGTGASLINFFRVPGVADQNVARDVIILQSLLDGLDLLASDDFAPAFGNSTDLDDYNWGKLHRIVFSHPLGGPFNIPPDGHPSNLLGPDLPGFSRSGGMGAVDASSHSARADGLQEFMFSSGPARRFQALMTPECLNALEVIPGGESGQPGSPNASDQLGLWLVNAYKPLYVCMDEVLANAVDTETYVCGDGVVGPGEQCDDGNANNNDGCNQMCRITPIVTCLDPTVSADPLTCTADVSCNAIASCVDPAGGSVATVCSPTGPYGLGSTSVSVECSAPAETTVFNCQTTVVDTTPPSITVGVMPDVLWPPNHRMVDVGASVVASDACGPVSVVLESVVSDEPDNAMGIGDGNTVNDIQGHDVGTEDYGFLLRAERAGSGDGRTYTVTYSATDTAGNQAPGVAYVNVPLDDETLLLTLDTVSGGTLVSWTNEAEPEPYNVIRTNLADLRDEESGYYLGDAACIEAGSLDQSTLGLEDPEVPAPGEVFLYLVEYDDMGFGTPSAAKPRLLDAGGCQ